MLGGLLFSFWRVFEIITLIPIIGMLVCINPSARFEPLLTHAGMVRQRFQSPQSVDASLDIDVIYRVHLSLRLGACDTDSFRVDPPISTFRCLRRSVIRGSLHCRSLRAAIHWRCQLFELQQR